MNISSSVSAFIKDEFHDIIIRFIINFNFFYYIVEQLIFCDLIHFCCLNVKLWDRTHLWKSIECQTNIMWEYILNDFFSDQKISVTADIWNNFNHLFFLTVLKYYIIDDWKYKEVLLAISHFYDNHTEKFLAQIVVNVLEAHKLSSQLLTVTADNADNNKTLCRILTAEFKKFNVDWNSEHNTIWCMTHVMQLTAEVFLAALQVKIKNDIMIKKISKKCLTIIIDESISFYKIFVKINEIFDCMLIYFIFLNLSWEEFWADCYINLFAVNCNQCFFSVDWTI